LTKGADKLKEGIIKTGEIIGKGIKEGGDYITEKVIFYND
jgi:hypothetical protein